MIDEFVRQQRVFRKALWWEKHKRQREDSKGDLTQLVLKGEKDGRAPAKGTVNAKARGEREHDRGHRRSLRLKAVGQVEGWGESDSALRTTGNPMTSSKVMYILERSL